MTILILSVVIILITVIFILPGSGVKDFLLGRLNLLNAKKDNLQTCFEILEKKPDDLNSLDTIAQFYFNNGDYENAYTYYSQIIVKLADFPAGQTQIHRSSVYLHFGIAAYHQGEKSEALASLQKAKMQLNQSSIFKVFYYIGMIYYQEGNYSEACKALATAYKQNPKHEETAYHLAICYFNLRKFDLAAEVLSFLLVPSNPGEIDFYLGVCKARLLQYTDAIPHLENASKNPEFEVPSWHELGTIYLEEKLEGISSDESQKNALDIYQNISQSADPDKKFTRERCVAFYQSAKLLAVQGSLPAACQALEQLMELDKDYEDVQQLYPYYAKSKDNPQLFRLLEGDERIRREIAISLAASLIIGAEQIEIVDMHDPIIEITALSPSNKAKFYLWICLQDNDVNLRQVSLAHINSKQYKCTHCILACLSDFELNVASYIEGQPIRLIARGDLQQYLQHIR